MHASRRDSVEIGGESRHQRLAFTGLHFRDVAQVKCSSTHQLNVKVSKTESPLRCFAHRGESLGKQIVERFSCRVASAEFFGFSLEFLVSQVREIVFEEVDSLGLLGEFPKNSTFAQAKNAFNHICHEGPRLSAGNQVEN